MPTPRPLSIPQTRGLAYLASKGGRIHHLDTTVRANTITALMGRDLVTQTVDRGTTLYYVLTDVGWAVLAYTYGVQVRGAEIAKVAEGAADDHVPTDVADDVDATMARPVATSWGDFDGAPLAHGEDGMPVDRPIPWVELYRWAYDDVLEGDGPLSCLPLGVATVPPDRPTGRDGDLLCAPWVHPADRDTSPFWQSCPTIRL